MDPLEIVVAPKINNIEDHIRLQHIPVLSLIVGFWYDHFLNSIDHFWVLLIPENVFGSNICIPYTIHIV